ncbi:hypothetical protein CAPTEDRAFT_165501 [Capitella teleta]|uniref:Centromere protein I n=1 Tax=Capitella teleta TaxID=283909 RepID=R7TNK7_CAPTE|nr:hypothetical protein CAPTEDRAFT_165501 [Capitella teleta]|eukprot:ELT95219.1 hypothetical protein CAPTEDRAFT_165501 [Capitella teleta]
MSLEYVEQIAAESGFSPDIIVDLLTLATSGKYNETVSGRLIRSLIPSTVIPEDAIINAVSSMCTNALSTALQSLLVRWLLVCYDVLESNKALHSLYTFLFYFLENNTLCPFVCHLLYLLTRKQDVTAFRVRALLQLQRKMGPQPHLMGLLSLCKLFCPQMVAIVIPKRRRNFFKRIDKAWLAKVKVVQDRQRPEAFLSNNNDSHYSPSDLPAKRLKTDLVPRLDSAYANTSSSSNHLPFAQIRNFNELLQNLDRLELPGQMAAVFKDRHLQHVLMCHPDPVVALRVQYWLDHVLYRDFLESPGSRSQGHDLLALLIELADYLQEGIPVCQYFLANFLHVWNGSDHRALVLKLLTRIGLQEYSELHDSVLEPLRKLFFASSVYFKCQVVVCLTELLHNLVTVEIQRHTHSLAWQKEQLLRPSLLSNSHSVFPEQLDEIYVHSSVAELIGFVGTIASLGLQVEHNNVLLMHCTLTFFEEVCRLSQHQAMVFLPNDYIVYSCLFSDCAMTLTRMCNLLQRYKTCFERITKQDAFSLSTDEADLRKHSLLQIQRYNSIVLDFIDTLWRYRAIISKESGSVYKLVTGITEEKVNHVLSIFQHHSMLGYVHSFLQKTQPEGTVIHPVALKKAKELYLESLKEDHLGGISEFLASSLKKKPNSAD